MSPQQRRAPASSPERVDPGATAERLVFFSDAVIAIVITLLVLEIKVPHVEEGGGTTLVQALLALWPTYLSFVISFVIIGITWANHHTMFTYIRRTNHPFLMINILFLLCVAAIPFSAALLGEYIQRPEEQTAAVVYGLVLTVGGVFFNLIWWYATHGERLIDPASNGREVQALTRYYVLGPTLYLGATLLALWRVEASLGMYIVLALLFALPLPSRRTPPAHARRAPPPSATRGREHPDRH